MPRHRPSRELRARHKRAIGRTRSPPGRRPAAPMPPPTKRGPMPTTSRGSAPVPDIEFLPAWYAQSRRKKRVVLLQFYMTLVLALGLGLWMLLIRRNTVAAAASLDQINQQVSETHSELRQLDDQVRLKDQLMDQQRVVDSLGVPVDVARLFHT